ncbi:hypothetical protein GGQ85_000999 [Nitrobacter vulgaris]|nr:hypothetical protein [Nitrobacter vulgaris]
MPIESRIMESRILVAGMSNDNSALFGAHVMKCLSSMIFAVGVVVNRE